jgi:ribosomal protein L7/L12
MKLYSATLDFESNRLTVHVENVQEAFDLLRQDQPATPAQSLTVEHITEPIKIMWKAGYKINAIKLYRQVTGGYLKDAKQACEVIGGSPLNYR